METNRVKYYLGETRLDPVSRADLLRIYDEAITARAKTLILHQNLHGIYVERQALYPHAIFSSADWVYVDGMPLVWFAKAAGFPFEAKHRITLLDCFDEILDQAQHKRWRIFYLGGKKEVLDAGLAKIRGLRPLLQISGRDGYFRKDQREEIIAEINAFEPDILFVGLGMPIQEQWVADNYDSLQVLVVTTSGATLEYTSGHSHRPAAWAGKLGLQGVLRFVAQPRRLWRRYLLEPLVIAPYILRSILKERRQQRSAAEKS